MAGLGPQPRARRLTFRSFPAIVTERSNPFPRGSDTCCPRCAPWAAPRTGCPTDDAIDLAAALGAKVSAIACEVKISAPGSPLGNYLLDIPAMVAAEAKKSATNAQHLLTAFQDAAEKRGVLQERISEQCRTSEVPAVFIEYARLRDLTIVPVHEGDYVDQWYAESIIFGSGRPTVVLPHTRKQTGSFALDTVIAAWDFSRPATRAIADAMTGSGAGVPKRILAVAHRR